MRISQEKGDWKREEGGDHCIPWCCALTWVGFLSFGNYLVFSYTTLLTRKSQSRLLYVWGKPKTDQGEIWQQTFAMTTTMKSSACLHMYKHESNPICPHSTSSPSLSFLSLPLSPFSLSLPLLSLSLTLFCLLSLNYSFDGPEQKYWSRSLWLVVTTGNQLLTTFLHLWSSQPWPLNTVAVIPTHPYATDGTKWGGRHNRITYSSQQIATRSQHSVGLPRERNSWSDAYFHEGLCYPLKEIMCYLYN